MPIMMTIVLKILIALMVMVTMMINRKMQLTIKSASKEKQLQHLWYKCSDNDDSKYGYLLTHVTYCLRVRHAICCVWSSEVDKCWTRMSKHTCLVLQSFKKAEVVLHQSRKMVRPLLNEMPKCWVLKCCVKLVNESE